MKILLHDCCTDLCSLINWLVEFILLRETRSG